jgi:hypothetical protein
MADLAANWGAMNVLGIDFTSRPTLRKRLTCLQCILKGRVLHVDRLEEWSDFTSFEAVLARPGPWISGIDFPFGQSRRFIENIGWPSLWSKYVAHVGTMSREGFRDTLDAYRLPRRHGDKEHRRVTDILAKSVSPQKLYGVPVGLMFFEGAPRLFRSGATIPLLHPGDPSRVVVEAYPGVFARGLIGRVSYKHDDPAKQTKEQHKARCSILRHILNGKIEHSYGLIVEAPSNLADDPRGDRLDALLCAIQAAWAWTMRDRGYGAPSGTDTLEGWIADPSLCQAALVEGSCRARSTRG